MVQELPIEEQPWYFGNTPRDDCVALLKRDGDFLVRFSTTTNGYVVTFWWKGKAFHGHIEQIKSKVHTYVTGPAKTGNMGILSLNWPFLNYETEYLCSVTYAI